MKRKQKDRISFPTKYKVGQTMICKKDISWNDETFFTNSKEYVISGIRYSRVGSGDSMEESKTTYSPYYIFNKDGGGKFQSDAFAFRSSEVWTTNEKTYGAEGMSSFGDIDECFNLKK